jgi:CBS domain-containing protein
MRARDVMRAYPVLDKQTPADQAADQLAQSDVDVVFVVDGDRLAGIVTDLALLRFLLPRYVTEDAALARVLDEAAGRELWRALHGRTVADLLPADARDVPEVDIDDTVLWVAARMCTTGSFHVAVRDHGDLVGGITSSAVITALRGNSQ